MKRFSDVIKIAAIVLGLTAPMTAAFADQDTLPPWQLPELTAEWWQWIFSMPVSVNPNLDATGDQCMLGQRGPIWFLAGSFLQTVTRTCKVPADTAFFFPVINNVQFDSPNLCGQDSESLSVKQLRKNIKGFVDDAHDVYVKVDDHYVKRDLIRRIASPVFWTPLPADNIFGGGTDCPAGIYSPSVSDGYWLALDPMKPGSHTIHFHGESQGSTVDVTYNLTVVPVKLK